MVTWTTCSSKIYIMVASSIPIYVCIEIKPRAIARPTNRSNSYKHELWVQVTYGIRSDVKAYIVGSKKKMARRIPLIFNIIYRSYICGLLLIGPCWSSQNMLQKILETPTKIRTSWPSICMLYSPLIRISIWIYSTFSQIIHICHYENKIKQPLNLHQNYPLWNILFNNP